MLCPTTCPLSTVGIRGVKPGPLSWALSDSLHNNIIAIDGIDGMRCLPSINAMSPIPCMGWETSHFARPYKSRLPFCHTFFLRC